MVGQLQHQPQPNGAAHAKARVIPIWSAQDDAPETDLRAANLRDYLMADAAGQDDWTTSEAEAFAAGLNQDALRDMHLMQGLYAGRIGMQVLAPQNAKSLAVIGSGVEAEMQIRAALDARDIQTVRIYARKIVAAASLAKKFRNRVPRPIEICASPEEAVHRAEIVILATGTAKPTLDPDWVMHGVHITCAFPQEIKHHELPLGMLSRAKIIASDSPRAIGKNERHLMGALATRRSVIHLGAMIDRFNPDRARGTTLLLLSGAPRLGAAMQAYHRRAALD